MFLRFHCDNRPIEGLLYTNGCTKLTFNTLHETKNEIVYGDEINGFGRNLRRFPLDENQIRRFIALQSKISSTLVELFHRRQI